ncbi:aldose epimerase family protein [Sorangium atrum]|uniref:Galactose mutarotase n=1 Tax=Sorangium atrum TaxID=2995308 RepID=A0ABT5C9C8_9BACT|nr:galactose mutarotase [Sorangium aterium]MDC0682977.1 galactose mutarotase [Sorangium aterium]
MFSVKQIEGAIPTVELVDGGSASRAVLAPARGGILTELALGGRELLYLDRATFEDRSANVRGGNPVLFPSPGKLAGDAWSAAGAAGQMRQHGFARTLPWSLDDHGTLESGGAYARLVLRSSEATRAQYPWDFRAEFTYTLLGRALRIDLRITNETGAGAPPMPFGAGFHPYFAVSQADKARASIETRATRAFDNTTKREAPFSGFDLTRPEVDLHLLDHGSTESSLSIEGTPGVRIAVRGSPEFTHWVVWTLQGKDFVCLEPWTCPGDALNTGERLIHLRSHETRALWIELSA